ncbi:Protein SOK1 [Smittium mucronatum]|uniref:Protein SOK1 n=1 Tax=Smittium mucronatum TaxID=133383 RepID=A0A1R0H078_9FUNG|nr:Protein SOK1 [Smittium mucronatum]
MDTFKKAVESVQSRKESENKDVVPVCEQDPVAERKRKLAATISYNPGVLEKRQKKNPSTTPSIPTKPNPTPALINISFNTSRNKGIPSTKTIKISKFPTLKKYLDKNVCLRTINKHAQCLQAKKINSCLQDLPPINHNSLKELGLAQILQNCKLRHEIAFEPKLEFRPNLLLAHTKRIKNDRYWARTAFDFRAAFSHHPPPTFFSLSVPSSSSSSAARIRAATFLYEIKLILTEIVCDWDPLTHLRNQLELVVGIDPDPSSGSCSGSCSGSGKNYRHCHHTKNYSDIYFFESIKCVLGIMHEIDDEVNLGLASWINEIRHLFTARFYNDAFAKTFSLLEHFKIGIANKNIQLYRQAMVASGPEFELKYFMKLLSRQKLDITATLQWWDHQKTMKAATNCRSIFIAAFTDLLLHPVPTTTTNHNKDVHPSPPFLPATFHLDISRIKTFQRRVSEFMYLYLMYLHTCQFLHRQNKSARLDISHLFIDLIDNPTTAPPLPTSSNTNSSTTHLHLKTCSLTQLKTHGHLSPPLRKVLESVCVSDSSKLVRIVRDRIRQFLIAFIETNQPSPSPSPIHCQFGPFTASLIAIGSKLKSFVDYHYSAFAHFYQVSRQPDRFSPSPSS